jgi:peptidoglycan/LPS O-acetylase OafA/YrhL
VTGQPADPSDGRAGTGGSPSGSRPNVQMDSLTALRGIGACMVFVRHGLEALASPAHARSTFVEGATGVSFFFVLSGFVMAWTHRPHEGPLPFWRRRAARIYPAYLVGLCIGGVINHTLPRPTVLLATATLTQSWVPSPHYYFGVNGVGWSLSCEAFFYLVCPAMLPLLLRLSPRSRHLLVVGLFAAAVAIPLLVRSVEQDAGMGFWVLFILPATRLLEFALGACVGAEFRAGRRCSVPLSVAFGVSVVAIALAGYVPVYLTWTVVTLAPFMLLVAAAATTDLRAQPTWIRWRPFVVLGTWSYAFYLIHQSVIAVVARFVPHGTWLGFAGGVCAIVVAWFCAALLYRWVERPWEARLRGGRPRRPETA